MQFKIFKGDIQYNKLDRETFSFSNSLTNSPVLEIDHLLNILKDYPKEKVTYSDNIKSVSENLDQIIDEKCEINFDEIKKVLLNGNALIAVRNFELHPSIKPIFEDIKHDIGLIMKANKTGNEPIDPHLWLFIASPNAKTPYHLDRSSNFILQIRGSKELAVFPPRDERIMKKTVYEAYMDWSPKGPEYSESFDSLGTKYKFKAGDAAHIPFISGHYVKNGNDDISITISVFFNTKETDTWTKAMRMNNRLRKIGISTKPVGSNKYSDNLKASLFNFSDKLFQIIKS